MANRISASRARFYEVVRTAHLERSRDLTPAAVIYRHRRYDFEQAAAAGIELHQVDRRSIIPMLLRSRVREIEVNEPMSLELSVALLAVTGAAICQLLGRRTLVTAYAIANASPGDALSERRGPKGVLRRAFFRAASWLVWSRLDRIAYGTEAARALYHSRLPRRVRLDEALIVGLPAARPVCDEQKLDGTVVFLGAFVERKGLPLVLEAWSAIRGLRPDATLTVLGKGPLAGDVACLATGDPAVQCVIDPSRDTIFAVLARSRVLVLPSQPTPIWREQVGLPITEALSSGCAIVTTDQTGLAGWLAAHGHEVVRADADADMIASAIIRSLDRARTSSSVLADLPRQDGRLAADGWLFRSHT